METYRVGRLFAPQRLGTFLSVIGIYRHLSDFDSMSERNLDAKGRTFYSLPRKLCYPSLELSLGG